MCTYYLLCTRIVVLHVLTLCQDSIADTKSVILADFGNLNNLMNLLNLIQSESSLKFTKQNQ